MMAPIEIPTLLFWENKNSWYGSKGNARFFIRPVFPGKDEDPFPPYLETQLWRGPLNKDLSEILATVTFPLSEEGLDQTVAWLEARAADMN